MAVSPTTSSRLELSMSLVPAFHSGNNAVRDLDINQVPEEDEWITGSMEEEEEEEDDEEEEENGQRRNSGNGNGNGRRHSHIRKKLRLSKEQSHLLEQSFRQNHTLNPKQKETLAQVLKLKPRQVEVWFQNRRARSKLKQTEMECEYLKRWFGLLTDENKRLEKEVEELRAIKVAPPTVISPDTCEPLPAANLTMCPRCQRVTTTTSTPLSLSLNDKTRIITLTHHTVDVDVNVVDAAAVAV